MKVIVFLFGFLFLIGCQAAWYRQLPEGNESHSRDFTGVWKKKSNPRSAINSTWHKNQWSEQIVFQPGFRFIKTYEAEDWIGNTLTSMKIEGHGVYRTKDNWILLETKKIYSFEKKNDEITKKSINDVDSNLLYYYYLDGNLIIPMIYDMGYNEKDFGVKDGIFVPYDETNLNFFRYIKIYAFKEFQSHAYYPEK